MLDLCRKLKIPCIEKTLQRHDLYVSDECFLTGTGAEVIAVTRIDNRQIADGQPGPITKKLRDAFHQYTKE
jgi:branched-chain amino acid aminotransferase